MISSNFSLSEWEEYRLKQSRLFTFAPTFFFDLVPGLTCGDSLELSLSFFFLDLFSVFFLGDFELCSGGFVFMFVVMFASTSAKERLLCEKKDEVDSLRSSSSLEGLRLGGFFPS